MIPCEYCGNEIRKDVKKCHFCGSFQGVKGLIAHWGNTISVLLALISILALLVPPAITALKGDYSDVSATIVDADFGNYEVLLTNIGNRPSVLISAGIEVKKEDDFIAFFSIDLGENNRKVIPENGSTYIYYSSDFFLPALADSLKDKTDLDELDESDCFLQIRFSQFNNEPEKKIIEYDCLFVSIDDQEIILEATKNGNPVPGLSTVKILGKKKFFLPTKESLSWARNQRKSELNADTPPPVR